MNIPHKLLVKSLTQHSQALALPLGRRVGQPGHDVARDYLLKRMTRMQLAPFEGDSFELCYERPHPMGKHPQAFTNLVGVIPGSDRSLPPILLGAHYDSVIDAPCVDDNATSVAHNLVLASHYALRPLGRDLIIAFFDAEEPPFYLGPTMGSRRFVEDHCEGMRFAAVCSVASVIGAVIGYIIGAALWGGLSGFFFDHVPGFSPAGFERVQTELSPNDRWTVVPMYLGTARKPA
jgi:hypothetical protein